EFRQLRGAYEGVRAHDKRRTDFGVTMLACLQVETEIDQRPLELRSRAGETDEAAAAELGRALEIEKAEAFSEFDVVERFDDLRLFPPGADDGIVARILASGCVFMWKIRDVQEQIALGGIRLGRLLIQYGDLVAEAAHGGLDFRGVLALRLFRADFLADALSI